jgi:hypothetical protein
MIDYGEVLSKAWKIVWKHKILWVFGILASFGQGSGGGSGGGGSNTRGYSSGSDFDFSSLPPEWLQFFSDAERFLENVQWWGWVLLVLGFLLLIVVSAVLSTIGKSGLIVGTKRADTSDEKLTLGNLLSGSMQYFWRVFWFNFLAGLAIMVILLIILLPMVFLGVITAGVGMLCLIPLICLLVPVSWLLSILLDQSIIAIVVENTGMIEGLKRGWQVCRQNPWQLILMGLILGIGGGVVNFILAIPVFLALIPVILPFVTGSLEALSTAGMISLLLCCLYLPVLYLFTGVLTAYIQSAWTLTYIRLTGKPVSDEFSSVDILPDFPPLA